MRPLLVLDMPHLLRCALCQAIPLPKMIKTMSLVLDMPHLLRDPLC